MSPSASCRRLELPSPYAFALAAGIALAGLAPGASPAATITVTGHGDDVASDGTVTLREALLSINAGADANADVEASRSGSYGAGDAIAFAIGTGAQEIRPASALPWVAANVTIDGSTQPGFAGQTLILIDGAGAGDVDGLGFSPINGAVLRWIVVQGFARDGIVIGDRLFKSPFDTAASIVNRPPSGALPVTLGHVVSRDNGGSGLRIEGGVSADQVESGGNGSDGVRVDSADFVALNGADVHDNTGAGVRVLRASSSSGARTGEGLVIGDNVSSRVTIGYNGGDGVVLGDPNLQTGIINARISNADVFGNETGILVRERNLDSASTHDAIVLVNIFLNRSSGLHVQQSYFLRRITGHSIEAFSGNVIHNNARVPSADCSGTQSAPQVWFEGQAPFPCSGDCTYRANDSGIPTDPVCEAQVAESDCRNQTDPIASGDGNEHSCVWNADAGHCDFGYPFRGVCDTSSPNILWGYQGTGLNLPNTLGLFASDNAAVNAEQNQWKSGGRQNQDFGTSGDDDATVYADSCGLAPVVCP
jgi:hypothetical protein